MKILRIPRFVASGVAEMELGEDTRMVWYCVWS
jgi:hypothetical protein